MKQKGPVKNSKGFKKGSSFDFKLKVEHFLRNLCFFVKQRENGVNLMKGVEKTRFLSFCFKKKKALPSVFYFVKQRQKSKIFEDIKILMYRKTGKCWKTRLLVCVFNTTTGWRKKSRVFFVYDKGIVK